MIIKIYYYERVRFMLKRYKKPIQNNSNIEISMQEHEICRFMEKKR